MKDYLRQLLERQSDAIRGRNVVREALQARILGLLQKAGAMTALAFQGGTALRFLYSLPRYSEDLDFSLENTGRYDLRAWLLATRSELEREGYRVDVKVSDRRTVHSVFVAFAGLLHEMGLSSHRDETLAVKVEVDTKPPAGAGLETTLVRRHETLRLRHHDRASLFAGKLHALLQRPFLKGRDVYDLVWYLTDPDWPAPNLELLNHALAQTGWAGPKLLESIWRGAVARRLKQLKWTSVVADVRPFLERDEDAALLDRAEVLRMLARRK